MSDFDISEIEDEDWVEITDLDTQDDCSSDSLSLVLLKFVRKQPFLANPRAINTTLALLICVFVLLFLVQPDISSNQALGARIPAQSSSLSVQSPILKEIIWIKIDNGVEEVRQAPAGIIIWHHCKLLNWHISRKYQIPRIFICK